MIELTENQLKFSFPEDWQASQFDKWNFYLKHFIKTGNANLRCSKCKANGADIACEKCGSKRVAGTKGVDFLAIDIEKTCWLVEVKDYRKTREPNFAFLADAVALKVRDTLACLVAAQVHPNNLEEQKFAKNAVRSKKFRIVLHLEQPTTGRRLTAKISQRANVLQNLKRFVKSIDAHPLVVDLDSLNKVHWGVVQIKSK